MGVTCSGGVNLLASASPAYRRIATFKSAWTTKAVGVRAVCLGSSFYE